MPKVGLLGVTVFFVLSGFLITRILITEIEETHTIDLKNFWVRRIRRLIPAVLSMAVVIIFVSAVVNRVVFTKGCKDFVASVLGSITGGRYLIRYLILKQQEHRLHLRIVGHSQ